MINRRQVKELKVLLRQVEDLLDAMDDETYAAVNDFADEGQGRYTDIMEWLHHIWTLG